MSRRVVEINNEQQLEDWLTGQPNGIAKSKEWAVAIAARAVARVMPLDLVELKQVDPRNFKFDMDAQKRYLAYFRAICSCLLFSRTTNDVINDVALNETRRAYLMRLNAISQSKIAQFISHTDNSIRAVCVTVF
jgi:hypothetical protein